jgi:site-specific DNA-methyltransferase (adenine-specific)
MPEVSPTLKNSTSLNQPKERAGRNRTLTLTNAEIEIQQRKLLQVHQPVSVTEIVNRTIHQDLFTLLPLLPEAFVDLLFLDPPYNLDKDFCTVSFKALSTAEYTSWLELWFVPLLKTLKPDASVYICGDWRSSAAIQLIAEKYLTLRNRITWEREKGRGANSNWKNCSEDIWFCTVSNDYYFNADAVKLKRKVLAPYRENGKPKDWEKTEQGNFRLTSPSNLWTDITVPFWSMPENTDHPTQKPEKLLAKLILASTRPNDFVFDPFLGSGTTSVVAKKLGRRFLGVEIDPTFACIAEKRLELATEDSTIQGYSDNVFWERNTLALQKRPQEDDADNLTLPL